MGAVKRNYPHLTLIAALLAMIGPFTIDAYLPSFPGIETTFNITRAMLAQSLGIYLAAFAISTLFWGPLSDRIGRRQVILISLLIYVVASAACAMAESFQSFMLLRVLQGVSASGGLIAGRAMIRDTHDAQAAHRAMSQVMLLFAVAPAIAPILGGWLHNQFGWQSIFWFLAGFGGFLLLLVVFIKETLADDRRQSFHPLSVFRVYKRSLQQGHFLNLIMSLSFAFGGLFLYIAGAPTIIYDFLSLGSEDFGVQFIPMVGGLMLGAAISSYLAHRWPVGRTVNLGFMVMALAVLLNMIQVVFLKATVITVIGPLVIYALGLALVIPGITILALDCFPDHRGSAASMQGFMQMFTMALVASIAVPLLHSQLLHFVLGQLLLIAGAFWSYYRRRHITPDLTSKADDSAH